MTDPKKTLIKNIPFSQAQTLTELTDYEQDRVVSRTLCSRPHVNITLFAFDRGEEISAHTSPGDAMVQVLDGRAKITIGNETLTAGAGHVVVMPANVPHAVYADSRLKMMLTVVKPPAGIEGL